MTQYSGLDVFLVRPIGSDKKGWPLRRTDRRLNIMSLTSPPGWRGAERMYRWIRIIEQGPSVYPIRKMFELWIPQCFGWSEAKHDQSVNSSLKWQSKGAAIF